MLLCLVIVALFYSFLKTSALHESHRDEFFLVKNEMMAKKMEVQTHLRNTSDGMIVVSYWSCMENRGSEKDCKTKVESTFGMGGQNELIKQYGNYWISDERVLEKVLKKININLFN